ncbi:MAG: hypothetical protein WCJ61_04850 [Paludibacter sp.]
MPTRNLKNTVDLSVNERIAVFEAYRNKLISSPAKVEKYLQSTGIYKKNGELTKAYR